MLNIDSKSFHDIARHATEDYPRECCGVLLGDRENQLRRVAQVVRCSNVHPKPEIRYEIAPSELISIQRDARDLQLEIIGFYHSHPGHPAACSATDLEEASWSNCSYLIVSVESQSVTAARSFVLVTKGDRKELVEEPVVQAIVQN